eukprot:m51a1_g5197 hypothetical protein (440) ;mRNA; r:208696-210268
MDESYSFDEALLGSMSLNDPLAQQPPLSPLGCPLSPIHPSQLPSVELVDFPSNSVKDGECILVGGAPTQYKFRLRLGGSLENASGVIASAHLLSLHYKDGKWFERPVEDGLKGGEGAAFDQGEAMLRLVLATAGRGAPWRIRFVVSDQVTGCALCSVDLPLRTFSKRHKVDSVLASPESLEAALGARGAMPPPPAASVPVLKAPRTPVPPQQQQQQQQAQQPLMFSAPKQETQQPQLQTPADEPRRTLAALAGDACATPQDAGLDAQRVAREAQGVFEAVLGADVAAARPLADSDVQYLRSALASLSGPEAAHAWLVRTATEVSKVPRLWSASDPRLLAGFVTKDYAEEALAGKEAGTFLLRWSSGEPGELVLAYVREDGSVDHCYVRSEGEALDETVIVERLLSSQRLRQVYDPASNTLAPTDAFRLRGRYGRQLSHL